MPKLMTSAKYIKFLGKDPLWYTTQVESKSNYKLPKRCNKARADELYLIPCCCNHEVQVYSKSKSSRDGEKVYVIFFKRFFPW